MKNILEWLELIQLQAPDRILFADEEQAMSRTQFLHTAQSIGTALSLRLPQHTGGPADAPRCGLPCRYDGCDL